MVFWKSFTKCWAPQIHPSYVQGAVTSEYCIFCLRSKDCRTPHWCTAVVKVGVEAAYICIHTFPSAKHSHTLFWKGRLFWAPLQRLRDHFFSCAPCPCGRPRLPGSVGPLFRSSSSQKCLPARMCHFHLGCDQTLQTWKELNVLGFLPGELGERFGMTQSFPTPCLFPNRVLAKSTGQGRWLTEIFCSKPEVHCLKAGASPNSLLEE